MPTAHRLHSSKSIVSGILLLDKPAGISSQQAILKTKRLFQSDRYDSRKAGHTGTLDPMATGLLPICFGEATKFSQFSLEADKSYEAILQLGESTDTGDKEGQILDKADIPSLTLAGIEQVAKAFLGPQLQTPPMYSAIKKEGKKLYEYARQGMIVERTEREIMVYDLTLDLIDATSIKLTATVSKGTYIRVLGEDIAKRLGTLGHLTMLRRIKTGDFNLAQAVTLDQLEDMTLCQRLAHLLPIDACLGHFAQVQLADDEVQRMRLGQRLNANKLSVANDYPQVKDECLVRLVDLRERFVGLGVLESGGRLSPKRMIAESQS